MSNTQTSPVKSVLIVIGLVLLPIVAARAESGADAWITMQAQSSLRLAEGTRASAVQVDTRNGFVTLYGRVRSEADRTRATLSVGRVPGVVGVRNLLQLIGLQGSARLRRSDNAVKADVENALNAYPSLGDSRITVRSVSNGVVLLGGDAASLNDNLLALRATANRPGVRQVYSEIEAMPPAPSEFVGAEDDVIRRGVTAAIADLGVRDSAEIRVVVRDGVVWLSGSVPTWQGNSSRLSAVRSVNGVRSIMNVLRVVPPPYVTR